MIGGRFRPGTGGSPGSARRRRRRSAEDDALRSVSASLVQATNDFHQPRRVEGRGRLEDDANAAAVRVEGLDVVGQRLVAAPVALVLVGVFEQDAMKLPDGVLGERDVGAGLEDQLHQLGVARDLLLVAAAEGAHIEPGQELLDLVVAELDALDAGR